MDISIETKWDTSQFNAAMNALPGICSFDKPPMQGAGYAAMAALLRYEQSRFVSASGGDGTWAPLSIKTIEARLRKQYIQQQKRMSGGMAGFLGKVSGKISPEAAAKIRKAAMAVQLPILWVTGTLESGLFENGSGHFRESNATLIREGVRGGSHPDAPVTVGELADIHTRGNAGKHLPARPVMFPPDQTTLTAVGAILADGINAGFQQFAAQFGGGPRAA